MVRVITSTSAAARLAAARRFAAERSPSEELVVVAASRGAADDFAREAARAAPATFGLYRFSLTQLASRLAADHLAQERVSAVTALGTEAVASRALFEAVRAEALGYFRPVSSMPGFPRALAQTLQEIAAAAIPASALRQVGQAGVDLAALVERFDEQLQAASAVDRAAFLRMAARAAGQPGSRYAGHPLLLLDVAISTPAERELVMALVDHATDAFATIPYGDAIATSAFDPPARVENIDSPETSGLGRIRRYLFAADTPPPGEPSEDVELFSAPGEGRESVEIARRVLREARRGVAFDRIAVVLRARHPYASVLEHALRRAGVPAYFDRGTRRPHPAGRAFLALLACAGEDLSARRFAEYLSLGQVPEQAGSIRGGAFPSSTDEAFGVLGERALAGAEHESDDDERDSSPELPPSRSPWRWERLLVDARVVAGHERWTRRLNGLLHECELQRRELKRSDPDSPVLDQLARKIGNLSAFSAFALPVVRTLSEWPVYGAWGEWLSHFDNLAPRVLRRPDKVLRVLADLRPMSAVGPVSLDQAREVLAERLSTVEAEPPRRRYGRVFVATPGAMRGRSFDVVFIPALAERMFPQKPREDPLLLDETRRLLGSALPTQEARAELERLQLRLAVGAADRRLYVSFPTLDTREGRPRVPSLYALEVWRAMTGRVPGADELQHTAARAARATLAWPAPPDPREAIDALEHDLAVLARLLEAPEWGTRGRAQYILRLNEALHRSVRERYMRGKDAWTHWDGLTRVTDATAVALGVHRLTARPYSLSALQRYSVCPYQFLLGAVYRLRPADDFAPLQRLDPLTKGSLFHEIQAAFYRRLRTAGQLPVVEANRERALTLLDAAVYEVATTNHELLAPAVERVWNNEIAAIRRDLRLWVGEMAGEGAQWMPLWFEWSFGLGVGDEDHDAASTPEPVLIDNRFPLRGSIDLVEERAGGGELRVTDHKTGKFRLKERVVVGGGAVLQPVLYGMALEAATKRTVVEGRLYYATTEGGFRRPVIALTADARRAGIEVLDIIDRAVAAGFLPPVPAEGACAWCDFRPVCGPGAERRVRFKSQEPLADLLELRKKP